MAMEKAVKAADVGGVREPMGVAGVMVPSMDSDALGGAMLDIIERTGEDRHTIGCAARERIENKFSMDTKTNEREALCRTLFAVHE